MQTVNEYDLDNGELLLLDTGAVEVCTTAADAAIAMQFYPQCGNTVQTEIAAGDGTAIVQPNTFVRRVAFE